ncbi:methyltransferase-like protein 17, mitochondrial isoform X2 [Acanthaster planci]|uniref:Methyltransferase-like protein 17, mitochondrial isoform X2 n=1 Tax=Acanthaster planci TaxID=133434 RepID=A0A8B7YF81_ACAPL|nr:methyltransferase-like protein 17, mitochondrial isoform X2 [Acanthaster planci]
MAASMDSMFRLLAGKRKMHRIVLRSGVIMNVKRWLATVANYQTTVDNSLTELKTFRKHPGIMRTKNVKLPDALLQTLNRYLADKPMKQLAPRAKALSNYLWSRQLPLEEAQLRAKAQEYAQLQGVEDIDEDMLHSQDLPKDHKKKVASIMNKLRRHIYHWQPIRFDETTVCAYTMSRIAPNYATIYRVLHEIKKRVPDFSPEALLDFGSGIGTVSWAAHALWGNTIKEFYCVDTSREMHDVAEALMKERQTEDGESRNIIKGVYFRHFLPMSLQKYDLTISAYSLLELPSRTDRLNTLRTLWRKTDQFLILIECGTNEGYKTIMEARDFILNDIQKEEERNLLKRRVAEGVTREVAREEVGLVEHSTTLAGHVFAPCQHDQDCPRITDSSKTPCNFEQDFHHFSKREEIIKERFSYLVLRKGPRISGDDTGHWPRIVRPVLPRSRHVICRLCCSNGQLEEAVITRAKHGRELYRCARYSAWGDLLPICRPQENVLPEQQTDTEGLHSDSD